MRDFATAQACEGARKPIGIASGKPVLVDSMK